MILVDTSVWIDHFRGAAAARRLAELLDAAEVGVHSFVLGELALGGLGRQRARILGDVATLPRSTVLSNEDVLRMIDRHRLAGSGIGWVDAHLVAAALHDGKPLWTHDRVLARVAARLRLNFEP